MKKFMLSAIGVMAFSVSSVGNTIELPDKENLNLVIPMTDVCLAHIPTQFIALLIECSTIYTDVRSAYTKVLGEQQATSIAQRAFVGCMGGI
jgi:hypothetical protein